MALYFLGEKYLKPRYNKIIFFYMFLSSARQPNASISIESDVSEKEKKNMIHTDKKSFRTSESG